MTTPRLEGRIARRRASVQTRSGERRVSSHVSIGRLMCGSIYWADWMVDWPTGHEVRCSTCLLGTMSLACLLAVQAIGVFEHVFVHRSLIETMLRFEQYEANYVFPLYLYETMDSSRSSTRRQASQISQPHFSSDCRALRSSARRPHGLPAGLTPEDIFHYAYAVFHSPGYRSRYAEFLKIDFPRLPLTGNLELFRALAHLGGELVALHLLESPKLDKPITEFIGGRNPEVEKVSWSKNTVWLDKAQTTGFNGVPRGRVELPHRRLPGLREVAQGPQGPHALEGRHRPLPEDRRRPLRNHPPDGGDRRGHRQARRLAGRIPDARHHDMQKVGAGGTVITHAWL